ncbi:MAG: methionine biosynthesis protein MetW [Candidatus Thorarchaeota archaeon]|nr:methionine biosynthesis protein MetW [Candidatus Thorarchaeota archaeon]
MKLPDEGDSERIEKSDFYDGYWNCKFSASKYGEFRYLPTVRFQSIRELLPKSFVTALDIGCGDGTTLRLLERETGVRGEGVDVSLTAVERAIALGVSASVHDADSPFSFEDSSFDLIICSEVLEHLKYPHICIAEMKRILKLDGVIIISIPNLGFIKRRLRLLVGRNPFDSYEYHLSEHLHHWTNRSFRAIMVDFGFDVDKMLPIRTTGLKNSMVSIWPALFSDYLFYLIRKKSTRRTKLRCSMRDAIDEELSELKNLRV